MVDILHKLDIHIVCAVEPSGGHCNSKACAGDFILTLICRVKLLCFICELHPVVTRWSLTYLLLTLDSPSKWHAGM